MLSSDDAVALTSGELSYDGSGDGGVDIADGGKGSCAGCGDGAD